MKLTSEQWTSDIKIEYKFVRLTTVRTIVADQQNPKDVAKLARPSIIHCLRNRESVFGENEKSYYCNWISDKHAKEDKCEFNIGKIEG